jgi:hypothetical protein
MHAHLSHPLASQRSSGLALGSRRMAGPFAAPLPAPTPRQQHAVEHKAWAQQEDARQPRGFQTCQQDMYE